ncbi:hypothetical protein ACOTJC_29045 [Achromobacter xylosoxidans]|uniref:hypothetical protein n=1 Tax=Alcaligenes xylosoxydans xylosoxydans TaxID=85698 RepID=UPI002E195362|nr:hypothetical protein [Achromobacter xylosoxidans]
MTTTIPAGWKLVPASLYDLILTGDLEALLWQLKGVREAESVRMALYSARQAILDAEEYSDGTPCAAPGVSTVGDAQVLEFVHEVAQQKPEKPDHWSSCGQCQSNSRRAEELLDELAAQRKGDA